MSFKFFKGYQTSQVITVSFLLMLIVGVIVALVLFSVLGPQPQGPQIPTVPVK